MLLTELRPGEGEFRQGLVAAPFGRASAVYRGAVSTLRRYQLWPFLDPLGPVLDFAGEDPEDVVGPRLAGGAASHPSDSRIFPNWSSGWPEELVQGCQGNAFRELHYCSEG